MLGVWTVLARQPMGLVGYLISDLWKVRMTSLQSAVRRYLTPILLLLLVGGFLVVLGELYLYHHWDGTQLIGLAATVIGLVRSITWPVC